MKCGGCKRIPTLAPVDRVNGQAIWMCSHCRGRVAEGMALFGHVECELCRWQAVRWVACSRACLAALLPAGGG